MASGVAISDEVIEHFNLIQVHRQGDEERERFKLMVMRISDDQKTIIVDHDNCLKIKDVEKAEDVFQMVVNKLPAKQCRYALYDCFYKTEESVRKDLVFIMWAPEDAHFKSKMLYASSKVDLKKKLKGLKFEWQVNDIAEKHRSCLLEKLGQKITTLEGKAV